MPHALDICLTGRNNAQYGMCTKYAPFPNVAVGITAGNGSTRREKTLPNEDCLGVATYPDGARLYMVADSHFGIEAAELAMDNFPILLEDRLAARQDDIAAMRQAAFRLDGAVGGLRKDGSASTFLAMLQRGRMASYVSIGDSLLYTFTGNDSVLLNGAKPGELPHYLVQDEHGLTPEAVRTGRFELREKETAFLATDGLAYFSIADVCQVLQADIHRGMDALLQGASTGCPDNLAAIAVRYGR